MPLTGLIGGRILCMHGGLSPQLTSLDQLRTWSRPQVYCSFWAYCSILVSHTDLHTSLKYGYTVINYALQDPPNPSMGIDLLWSDPDPWVKGWQVL